MNTRPQLASGFGGCVDTIEPVLSGWVAATDRPDVPVTFVLAIDATAVGDVVADRPRPDVAAAGMAGTNCGFAVALPSELLDGHEHEVRLVLADGRALNLPGLPCPVALGPVTATVVSNREVSIPAVLDLLRRNDAEAGFDPGLIGEEHALAFSGGSALVFCAQVGERLVGYARLERPGGGFGVVALTVLEAYRRKGLGERMMRALMHAAAASGLAAVWLSVRPDNAPARRLYDKLGFRLEWRDAPARWMVPGELAMVWHPAG